MTTLFSFFLSKIIAILDIEVVSAELFENGVRDF